MTFPAFSYDSGSWYGNVDDAETFVIALRAHSSWRLSDEEMFEKMLDCRNAKFIRVYDEEICKTSEEVEAANKAVLLEQRMMGTRPSFGFRREHLYGDVKLRKFLGEAVVAEIRELLLGKTSLQ